MLPKAVIISTSASGWAARVRCSSSIPSVSGSLQWVITRSSTARSSRELAGACGVDVVARAPEDALHRRPELVFVVHHQDASHSAGLDRLRGAVEWSGHAAFRCQAITRPAIVEQHAQVPTPGGAATGSGCARVERSKGMLTAYPGGAETSWRVRKAGAMSDAP